MLSGVAFILLTKINSSKFKRIQKNTRKFKKIQENSQEFKRPGLKQIDKIQEYSKEF